MIVTDLSLPQGARRSLDSLAARLADVPDNRRLDYLYGPDVVYHPRPAPANVGMRVPVYKNTLLRGHRRGLVVHSIVEDLGVRAEGETVGWVAEPGQERRKGGDVLDAAGIEYVRAETVPYDEMPQWLAGLAVIVVPTRRDFAPRIVIEAASAGVPVVSSNIPMVRETGCSVVYLPLDRPEEWRHVVRRLAFDPPRSEARELYEAYCKRTDQEVSELRETLVGGSFVR